MSFFGPPPRPPRNRRRNRMGPGPSSREGAYEQDEDDIFVIPTSPPRNRRRNRMGPGPPFGGGAYEKDEDIIFGPPPPQLRPRGARYESHDEPMPFDPFVPPGQRSRSVQRGRRSRRGPPSDDDTADLTGRMVGFGLGDEERRPRLLADYDFPDDLHEPLSCNQRRPRPERFSISGRPYGVPQRSLMSSPPRRPRAAGMNEEEIAREQSYEEYFEARRRRERPRMSDTIEVESLSDG